MKKAIVLGTFDGLHKGHRAVLSLAQNHKRIAVTFKEPPKMAISGDTELVMGYEEKCNALLRLGIDEILTLDFNRVKNTSAQKFLEFLYDKYKPSLMCCGFNYRFGKGGEGTIADLERFCREKGIEFKFSQPIENNGEVISSTLIRQMLKDGLIEEANELLSRPFSFESVVLHGDKRGRTIGFPTANQKYPDGLVKLRFGVYKTKISFDKKEYFGITNIGLRPTYKSDYVISETYIEDFSEDLYGKKLRITPLKFLRDEIKFSSVEELKKQITADLKL